MRKLLLGMLYQRLHHLLHKCANLPHHLPAVRASSYFPSLHSNGNYTVSPMLGQKSLTVSPGKGCISLGCSPCHLLSQPSLTWSTCRTYAKRGKDKGGKSHKKVVLSEEELVGLVNVEQMKQEYHQVLEDLKDKFIHQLTVRTSLGVFERLIVKTPEGNYPLIQLGQVIQKSPQLYTINMAPSPQYITQVKEALAESGLNVNPQQDGTSLFIPISKVTREHRENLAKNAKAVSEKSKKQLRDIYSKYSRKIKSSKEGHSVDDLMATDDMVKETMHDMLQKIEEMTAAKQQELLGGK